MTEVRSATPSDLHAEPGGVHHVAIAVRDLETLEAFYTGVLGLPILRRWPEAGDKKPDRSVWLDLGSGAFLALERSNVPDLADDVARTGPSVVRTHGFLMIALRITRAARPDWEARLAAAGVAVVHRTDYTLYVADPEGNRIGLSHWPDAVAEPATQTRG
jgi:catechol 2,3-dioxygenase-like lactoylglutathione lyase family enzyme